jgi:hypothetical protein
MITENEKKRRVKGQESMKSKDYFDDYFEQLVSWGYEKSLRGLTKIGSSFGP